MTSRQSAGTQSSTGARPPGARHDVLQKIGGFVRDFNLDRKAFRVPPMVVKSLDLTQLYALEAGRQALADAGLLEPSEAFDRSRCAVVIGNRR